MRNSPTPNSRSGTCSETASTQQFRLYRLYRLYRPSRRNSVLTGDRTTGYLLPHMSLKWSRPSLRRHTRPSIAVRSAGFSMIELVIVLAVVGVLVSVAVFRSGSQLDRTKVQRAATMLVADLQYAQLQAVRLRTPVVLLVDGTTRGYLIRERDTPTVHRERQLGSATDFDLDFLSANPGDVEFFPNGVAREGTLFTLRRRGYERQVRVTRAGQVRIQNGP